MNNPEPMKTVINKAFAPSTPDAKATTVAELLEICLSVPPTGGFDFAIMRDRNRVADAVAPVKNSINADIILEDADFETAVAAIKNTRWARNDKHLLEFASLFGI